MIKMTNELFEKFATKQEELDSHVRESHGISPDVWLENLDINHKLALRGEVAEFINEARDLWKYWKKKKPNHNDLIDEAVDIIHFLHLIFNKIEVDKRLYVDHINKRIELLQVIFNIGVDPVTKEKRKADYRLYLNRMYEVNKIEDYLETYAILLCVLDRYNFTLDDIEQAYDRKNKENFKRQKNNY